MDTEKIDKTIQNVLHNRLKKLIDGKIKKHLINNHSTTLKKNLEEEAPTNAMGTSSSTTSSGPIDTFDPKLILKGVKASLARRKKIG